MSRTGLAVVATVVFALQARLLAQCGEAFTDFCSSARVVPGTPGTHEVLMDVAGATSSVGETLCGSAVEHTVWFEVTPADSGTMRISTCQPNTSYDTVLEVYSGSSCEFLNPKACNDDLGDDSACDNGCSAFGSTVSLAVTGGTRYWFVVGQYSPPPVSCTLCLGVRVTLCSGDVLPPVAAITSPADLGCICGSVNVMGTASDPDGNFDRYVLDYRRLNDPTWNVITTGYVPVSNGLLAAWNTTGLVEAYYVLRLTVTDLCGKSATAVRVVRVDGGPDAVIIASPYPGQILGRRVCVDGTVSDAVCAVTYQVDYQPVGGGTWLPVDPVTPTYTGPVTNEGLAAWDTLALAIPDGTYNLRVIGYTACGQVERYRIVVVDNTPPTAIISSPSECTGVTEVVEVRGTVNDANLWEWTLQYNGGDSHGWVNINSGVTPVTNDVLGTWDTTGLRRCAYALRLVANDAAVLGCNSAIQNQTQYLTTVSLGTCCDVNGDAVADGGDIQYFINCLLVGTCP